ncbi:MAG: MotA/TolQ/ExbB proton channel family protein [Pseudomonadales bacterium]|jgi:biopolymer transport protein ExbB|nr:MotA/TolQ/ExbB proton channel family protein [Pseudomonadales bacterium]MDP7146415.1 MotA/TolQ/ExbB proton channel family protein [Pseudomonadales bacterium]MDP7358245.1 MotA/TolQ/ExbB proton channel family protein [Pseudomonadales bacterium]MDP7597726.1 MotA/TolQ/ExbB proton channel family protein [Pseudomonadales bacterium]HJN49045.1 MotA/TolQ/ExbB proton channel family protein [Pseudomonadales bacterium]|tara:strand:+ start:2250 stop:2762 length:513 start_codon:yes stop_codon:yes gene_type:complete
MEILVAIQTFMEAGGDVLWLIAAATFGMWCLIFERFVYVYGEQRRVAGMALTKWTSRGERQSWNAKMIRLKVISEVNGRLNANMTLIKTFISLLPLLGLLGTVTGMVQVFEAMTFSGGNARSMAAGVSAATIPTMSGMVATLSGVFANTWLVAKIADESEYIEVSLTMEY